MLSLSGRGPNFYAVLVTTFTTSIVMNSKPINSFIISDLAIKILGQAQDSPAVQALCKEIDVACHDMCKALDGFKETFCFSGCVSMKKLAQLPFSFRKDVVDQVIKRIDNAVLDHTVQVGVDVVVDAVGKK